MSAVPTAAALSLSPRRPRQAASRHELAFARDVLAGLGAPRKSIAAERHQDARGAALLAKLVAGDAAHPARLEALLLAQAATSIAAFAGVAARVLELAPCLRLERAPSASGADELRCAIASLGSATDGAPRRRLLYVPGAASAALPCDATTARELRTIAERGRHDVVVVAADAGATNRGHNDRELDPAATALHRNLLIRVNRELGADFDPGAFDVARRLDPHAQCVEVHLVSAIAHRVRVLGHCFAFAAGESILVERKHSHCLCRIEPLLQGSGWRLAQRWVDAAARFAIHVLERA